jgi:hypothetical protein
MGVCRENFDLLSPSVPCRLLSPRLSSLVAVATVAACSLVDGDPVVADCAPGLEHLAAAPYVDS